MTIRSLSFQPGWLAQAILMVLSCLMLAVPAATAQAPEFEASEPLFSNTGHVLVQWQPTSSNVTLSISPVEAPSQAKQLYSGSDTSYFLSGLRDGQYILSLRDEDGSSSKPLKITVAHQSLAQALWLTVIGMLITLGIIIAILRGERS